VGTSSSVESPEGKDVAGEISKDKDAADGASLASAAIVSPLQSNPQMQKLAPAVSTDFNQGPDDCSVSAEVLAAYVSHTAVDGAEGSAPPSKHDLYCSDLWRFTLGQFNIENLNGATPVYVNRQPGFGPVAVGSDSTVTLNLSVKNEIPPGLRGKFKFRAILPASPDILKEVTVDAETLTVPLTIPLTKLELLKTVSNTDAKGNLSLFVDAFLFQDMGNSQWIAGPAVTFPVVLSGIADVPPAAPVSVSLNATIDGALTMCFFANGEFSVTKRNQLFSFSSSYTVSQDGKQTTGNLSDAAKQALSGNYTKACHPKLVMTSWTPVTSGRTSPPRVSSQNFLADRACLDVDDTPYPGAVHLELKATTEPCP